MGGLLSPLVIRLAVAAGALGIILGALGYLEHLRHENARLAIENVALADLARRNSDAAGAAMSEADRIVSLVMRDRDAALRRAGALQSALKGIRDAPASDDAPLAPVLRDALDGLRRARDGAGNPPPAH
jgi:hypothetical protein